MIPLRPIRTAALISAAAVAGGVAACHPKPMGAIGRDAAIHVSTVEPTGGPVTVAQRLTCPQTADLWTRSAAAADGASCTYTSSRGELDLRLVSGPAADPAAALGPERARLDALMPSATRAAMVVDTTVDADGRRHANVDMPFVHVREDGDHKSVKVMGLSVDRSGRDKDDGDADETPAAPGSGRKLVYVLAGASSAGGGWRAVGYQARADASGRMVVASFRLARGLRSHGDSDDDDDGVRHLLDLNAPVGAAQS